MKAVKPPVRACSSRTRKRCSIRSALRLAQPVHHGHRRLHALPVRLLLHAEPLFGLRLLLGDPLADLVHQDLAAAARNAVEPRRVQLADHVGHRQPEPLAEEDDLGRREAMDVDRVIALDVAHQVEIPLERDVRVVPALEQDLDAADRLALVDLGADLLEAQHVALRVLGPAVERAELAVGDADVGVVDVPVDDVGDAFSGCCRHRSASASWPSSSSGARW